LAFAGGILIFLGGRTSGTDIPTLIFNSLNIAPILNSNIIQNLTATVVGAFVAWLLILMVKKSKELKKLIYLFIMTSTFIIMTFSDMYLSSQFINSGNEESTLKVNLFFIIGLIISLLFQVDTKKLSDSPSSNVNSSNQKRKNNANNWRDKI